MFVGQQFTQNVLGYTTIAAAAVVLPAAVMTAAGGQVAGRLVLAKGSQFTFALGLGSVAAGFTVMLMTWHDGVSVWWVLVAYAFTGTGVGLSATPASRSLMSSVPVSRAGMGSAFLDLTRDFGGALIQALMGVLLAGVYARYFVQAFAGLPPEQAQKLSDDAAQQITSSYAGAEQVAASFPQANAAELLQAAATAFTEGKSAAIASGLVLTLLALGLVLWLYPGRIAEERYYVDVEEQASARAAAPQ